MKIKITGEPKEIAALVLAVQERQEEFTAADENEICQVTQQVILDSESRIFVPEDSDGKHNWSRNPSACHGQG